MDYLWKVAKDNIFPMHGQQYKMSKLMIKQSYKLEFASMRKIQFDFKNVAHQFTMTKTNNK